MNSLLIKIVQSCVVVCCESSFRKIENSPIKRYVLPSPNHKKEKFVLNPCPIYLFIGSGVFDFAKIRY